LRYIKIIYVQYFPTEGLPSNELARPYNVPNRGRFNICQLGDKMASVFASIRIVLRTRENYPETSSGARRSDIVLTTVTQCTFNVSNHISHSPSSFTSQRPVKTAAYATLVITRFLYYSNLSEERQLLKNRQTFSVILLHILHIYDYKINTRYKHSPHCLHFVNKGRLSLKKMHAYHKCTALKQK